MPSLHEIQQAMQDAILGRNATGIAGHIDGRQIAAEARLAIYRNTYTATLTRALRLTYPAVDRLVGSEFFDGAAMDFVHGRPPSSAWLDDYGAAFADFLGGFAPAASLPYLADVARLEWAVSRAIHAAGCTPLSIAAIAACDAADHVRIRFTPDPSLSLIRASHPADRIWRAVIDEDDAAMAAIDLADGSSYLRVQRREHGVDVDRLDPTAWAFTDALCGGQPLGSALAAHPALDASHLLADLLMRGCFTDFSLAPETDGTGIPEVPR